MWWNGGLEKAQESAKGRQATLPLSSERRRGSENENVEPWPSADSTQISPPCCSTIPFEITRPRPVPPAFRVVEESSWAKRWKRRAFR